MRISSRERVYKRKSDNRGEGRRKRQKIWGAVVKLDHRKAVTFTIEKDTIVFFEKI